jgi:hypothetical protein
MSKFTKVLGIVALALIINVGAAVAAGHGGHHGGGGHWHGGGWGGGGWGWGGFAAGAFLGGMLAAPYYYGDPGYYYYGEGDCGWMRVRVLRHGHLVVRRAWRCL